MGKEKTLITALFADRESVEMGCDPLSDRGYTKDDVLMVMSQDTMKRYYTSVGTQPGIRTSGWTDLPEERVKKFHERIRNGGILMGVRPRNDQDAAYFENEWRIIGAQSVCR